MPCVIDLYYASTVSSLTNASGTSGFVS